MKNLLSLALLAPFATAHFILQYPKSLGFSDDDEATAPCGGDFHPDFSNTTAYPLSGGQVVFDTFHPQALFLFRAQLEGKDKWIDLLPTVSEMGLGEFCTTMGPVPQNWTGLSGIMQVVCDGPDGILYQCAAVTWQDDANGTSPLCKNGSSVTGSFTSATASAATIAAATSGSDGSMASAASSASTSMAASSSSSSTSSSGGSASGSGTPAATTSGTSVGVNLSGGAFEKLILALGLGAVVGAMTMFA